MRNLFKPLLFVFNHPLSSVFSLIRTAFSLTLIAAVAAFFVPFNHFVAEEDKDSLMGTLGSLSHRLAQDFTHDVLPLLTFTTLEPSDTDHMGQIVGQQLGGVYYGSDQQKVLNPDGHMSDEELFVLSGESMRNITASAADFQGRDSRELYMDMLHLWGSPAYTAAMAQANEQTMARDYLGMFRLPDHMSVQQGIDNLTALRQVRPLIKTIDYQPRALEDGAAVTGTSPAALASAAPEHSAPQAQNAARAQDAAITPDAARAPAAPAAQSRPGAAASGLAAASGSRTAAASGNMADFTPVHQAIAAGGRAGWLHVEHFLTQTVMAWHELERQGTASHDSFMAFAGLMPHRLQAAIENKLRAWGSLGILDEAMAAQLWQQGLRKADNSPEFRQALAAASAARAAQGSAASGSTRQSTQTLWPEVPFEQQGLVEQVLSTLSPLEQAELESFIIAHVALKDSMAYSSSPLWQATDGLDVSIEQAVEKQLEAYGLFALKPEHLQALHDGQRNSYLAWQSHYQADSTQAGTTQRSSQSSKSTAPEQQQDRTLSSSSRAGQSRYIHEPATGAAHSSPAAHNSFAATSRPATPELSAGAALMEHGELSGLHDAHSVHSVQSTGLAASLSTSLAASLADGGVGSKGAKAAAASAELEQARRAFELTAVPETVTAALDGAAVYSSSAPRNSSTQGAQAGRIELAQLSERSAQAAAGDGGLSVTADMADSSEVDDADAVSDTDAVAYIDTVADNRAVTAAGKGSDSGAGDQGGDFVCPVDLDRSSAVYSWLTAMDDSQRQDLATFLEQLQGWQFYLNLHGLADPVVFSATLLPDTLAAHLAMLSERYQELLVFGSQRAALAHERHIVSLVSFRASQTTVDELCERRGCELSPSSTAKVLAALDDSELRELARALLTLVEDGAAVEMLVPDSMMSWAIHAMPGSLYDLALNSLESSSCGYLALTRNWVEQHPEHDAGLQLLATLNAHGTASAAPAPDPASSEATDLASSEAADLAMAVSSQSGARAPAAPDRETVKAAAAPEDTELSTRSLSAVAPARAVTVPGSERTSARDNMAFPRPGRGNTGMG
ncbi:hypothetical protein [Anaerobiospirillum sp. NML120449]|uniref:hypothetical protein n=1 Tax=Anaerobiospirillum sp. NML120449 TaxID=2932817 RepID=UPI001FF6464C|nr:hypothetical protein [Anaerobiospirillum sp. NML120449]MCK0525622.1 hypothetical protein [Anaerobiospirillum sp. NML120449]